MKLLKLIFFGNYFYGICSVALMIETGIILKIPLPPIVFFILVFMATVWFYTKAYIQQNKTSTPNERTSWYLKNRKHILNAQMGFIIAIPVLAVLLLPNVFKSVQLISPLQWLFLSIPILLALGYYGINEQLNFRRFLFLKPICIAVVWSFVACLLPLIYYQLQSNQMLNIESKTWWWAVVNFTFFLCLAIVFDVKDFAADVNVSIKTFVTKFGLKQIILKVLLPLSLIAIITFSFFYGRYFGFGLSYLINLIPYLLLITIILSLHKPKSIFFYLIVIDGLMFAKAIISLLTFKFL